MKSKIFQSGFFMKILSIILIASAISNFNEFKILSPIAIIIGVLTFWVYDWVNLKNLEVRIEKLENDALHDLNEKGGEDGN